jgi:hypothetical protein
MINMTSTNRQGEHSKMSTTLRNGERDALGGESPTNDAAPDIEGDAPYVAHVTVEGTSPILFHRWSNEAVAEKAAAKKGSDTKKTDNVESYVYRNQEGEIGIPGTYLVGSLTDPRNGAAKYVQDPRSPRKSALDLFRACVVPLTDLAPVLHRVEGGGWETSQAWDYLDERRVTVQRAAITRSRPAFHTGWRAEFDLSCLQPQYVSPQLLLKVLGEAGRLVGLGDFRPTFGRFDVVRFDVD